MRLTLFLAALAAMSCSYIAEAVPINADADAEFLGIHKLMTPAPEYCEEKFAQSKKAL